MSTAAMDDTDSEIRRLHELVMQDLDSERGVDLQTDQRQEAPEEQSDLGSLHDQVMSSFDAGEVIPVKAPQPEQEDIPWRNPIERVTDEYLGLSQGALNLARVPFSLASRVATDSPTFGPEGSVQNWFDASDHYIEQMKTPEIREMNRRSLEKINDAEGFWETLQAIGGRLLTPGLVSNDVAQTAPMLMGPLAVGTGTKLLGAGLNTQRTAMAAAGGLMEGAGAGDNTYDRVVNMPDEVFANNPTFQELIAKDNTPEQAKREIANAAAGLSTLIMGVASTGMNRFGPGAYIERFLVNDIPAQAATGRLGKVLGDSVIKRTLYGGTAETGVESVEGALDQFLANVAENNTDTERSLFQEAGRGVSDAAAVNAAVAGPLSFGASFGGANAQVNQIREEKAAEQAQLAEQQRIADEQRVAEAQAVEQSFKDQAQLLRTPKLPAPSEAPVDAATEQARIDEQAAAVAAKEAQAIQGAQQDTLTQRALRERVRALAEESPSQGVIVPPTEQSLARDARMDQAARAATALNDGVQATLFDPVEQGTPLTTEAARVNVADPVNPASEVTLNDSAGFIDAVAKRSAVDYDALFDEGYVSRDFDIEFTPSPVDVKVAEQRAKPGESFAEPTAAQIKAIRSELEQEQAGLIESGEIAPSYLEAQARSIARRQNTRRQSYEQGYRDPVQQPLQGLDDPPQAQPSAPSAALTAVDIDQAAEIEQFAGPEAAQAYNSAAREALGRQFGVDAVVDLPGGRFAIRAPRGDVIQKMRTVAEELKRFEHVGKDPAQRNVRLTGGSFSYASAATVEQVRDALESDISERTARGLRQPSGSLPANIGYTTKNGLPLYPRLDPAGKLVLDRTSPPSYTSTSTTGKANENGTSTRQRAVVRQGRNPQQRIVEKRAPASGQGKAGNANADANRQESQVNEASGSVGQVTSGPPASSGAGSSKLTGADKIVAGNLQQIIAERKRLAGENPPDAWKNYTGPAPQVRTRAESDRITSALTKLQDESNGRIVIHDTAANASDGVKKILQQRLESTGSPVRLRAVLFEDKVHIIADQIQRVSDIAPLVAHEVAHAALRGALGTELPRRLNELYTSIGGEKGFNEVAQRHGIDLRHYDQLYENNAPEIRIARMLDELLAHIAENDSRDAGQTKARKLAKALLRKLKGLLARFSPTMRERLDRAANQDAELARILNEAERYYRDANYPFAPSTRQLEEANTLARLFYDNDVPMSFTTPPMRPSIVAWLGRVEPWVRPIHRFAVVQAKTNWGKKRTLGNTTLDQISRYEGALNDFDDRAGWLANGLEFDMKKAAVPKDKRDDLYRQFNRYLAGDQKAVIPDWAKPRLNAMRHHLDSMSQRIADMKAREIDDKATRMLSAQSFAEYQLYLNTNGNQGSLPPLLADDLWLYNKIIASKGRYLHRSFAATTDPDYVQSVLDDPVKLNRMIDMLSRERKRDFMNKASRRKGYAEQFRRHNRWLNTPGNPLYDKNDPRYETVRPLPGFIQARKTWEDKQQIRVEIEGILRSAQPSKLSGGQSGRYASKDMSILMRRDLDSPAMRYILGEHTDARKNFLLTAHKMGELIASDTFLRGVRDRLEGSLLFHSPRGEFTQQVAPKSSKVYSPLNGMYAHPDFVAQLELLNERSMPDSTDLMRWYLQLNGWVKLGKTVWNEATQLGNIIGSAAISLTRGHLFDAKAHQHAMKLVYQDFGDKQFDLTPENLALREERSRLIQANVIGDGARSGEAKALEREMLGGKGISGSVNDTVPKRVINTVQKAYGWGDDYFKAMAFVRQNLYNQANLDHVKMWMVNQGQITSDQWDALSDGEKSVKAWDVAAERIRNTYPTYSKVPVLIDRLRRNIFMGNFVSFQSEMIRNSVEDLRYLLFEYKSDPAQFYRHITPFVVGMGLYPALSMLSRIQHDVDDEEDAARRSFVAEWSEYGDLFYTGRDENDNPTHFDLSRFNSFSMFSKPFRAFTTDNNKTIGERTADFIAEMVSPFTGFQILSGSVLDVLYNAKDREGGRQVYNPADDLYHKSSEVLDYIAYTLSPGFVTSLYRKGLALVGDDPVNEYGKVYSIGDEVAASFAFRPQTTNLPVAIKFQAGDFVREKTSVARIFTTTLKDRRDLSEERVKEDFNRMMQRRAKLYRKGWDMITNMRAMGKSDAEIRKVLNTMSDVSEEDRNALMNKRIPRYKLPEALEAKLLGEALYQFGMPTAANAADRARVKALIKERMRLARKMVQDQ